MGIWYEVKSNVVALFVCLFVFIRPFEKRSYYAVAISIRLSVRHSFSDFFQHALK